MALNTWFLNLPTYIVYLNYIGSQKIWDKKFHRKHHQLSCTLDAIIVLVLVLCTNLVYLQVIYQYIRNNNDN
jgi:hypothetical protein